MHFTIAHVSDPHLGPLPGGALWRNFRLKRVIGTCSWLIRRRRLHRPEIADAVRNSIRAARPDHVAVTGDVINIGAWAEFPRAAQWVEGLGTPETVTFVPGNHDAYVEVPWNNGLKAFAPWMREGEEDSVEPAAFPFVRLRRNVAIIGLNSGSPQHLFTAGGTLGERQLRELGNHLQRLSAQGFCRVVLIHHPPLPGLAKRRKALTDAAALAAVLKENGCELVLHGHNHRFMQNEIATRTGPAHIIGVPSASMRPLDGHDAAGWTLFRIRRQAGVWHIEMTRHIWNDESRQVEALAPALLSPA